MSWWKELKGKVKFSEPLKGHTTFKIGGAAKYFVEPRDIADLKLLLRATKKYKIPYLVIGSGSNILVNDKGIKAVVLRLNSPYFRKLFFKDGSLEVGAGYLLSRLLSWAMNRGLSGTEFLAGIPATVGGALVMNAGAWQKNIARLVENVSIMDYNGNVKTLNKDQINFGYRTSSLSKYIVLSARIKLINRNKTEIQDKIKEYLSRRISTQDLSKPSAGCVFKNPEKKCAARLIDLCGLKGKRIGNAYISPKHANFILNLGNARAKDVLELMEIAKKEVKRKFGIILKSEISIWQ